jgi:hypothetical protein
MNLPGTFVQTIGLNWRVSFLEDFLFFMGLHGKNPQDFGQRESV